MTKKLTYEFVYNYFKSQDCELLEKEYHGNNKVMNYICVCGEPNTIRFASFQNGARCEKCGIEKQKESSKLSYEQVYQFFLDRGCTLLEGNYINAQIKMKYICQCGRPDEKTYGNFYNGQRCKECGKKKTHEKQSLSFEFVKGYFEFNGCTLLDTEYKNNILPLKFICECNESSSTSFGNFQKGVRCKKCGTEKIKGENNYNWQGGITGIQNYLRSKLYTWKMNSLIANNYKCVITGIGGTLAVHHLHPFHKIIDEIMNKLNIPICQKINQYTIEEIRQIDEMFDIVHGSHKLGVPITEELHDEFHFIYGKLDFTSEDFEEFRLSKQPIHVS